jgi:hypothetical protein
MLDHSGYQGFLAREIVMECSNVDTHSARDLSGPQTFEALLGQDNISRLDQFLTPLLAAGADYHSWLKVLGGSVNGHQDVLIALSVRNLEF